METAKGSQLTINIGTADSTSVGRYSFNAGKTFKGTVSRELRHRLLYIIRKLFSRPIIASHKILILLNGQFVMYIKQFSVS